ncbi:conserved hypothetical protein [Halobacteriovorax marinus SJ]|uniref:Lipid/polyisoprenoid-binding YceI-like domain-containing protein n=1 Tax=Halobacteriovorax marinus (strain ATCC BAA-682 / DSM 15412 / SJ) TaxID=862908 RepID=E1X1Z9_HALMS|nr:YceI family protein [Halobacteriovorax marinus]CBW26659.1 conserved hypothetical protein [Halobacteriovorax marinus SJ]
MKKIISILLLLSSLSISASNWRVNWQHSKVGFQITYMGLSKVDGAFTKFDGAFDFDHQSKKLENVEFHIQTKSIDTNNTKRDNHIKNQDFFYVNKYPKITFTSKKTEYTNGVPTKLIGEMQLLNTKKDVEFKVDYKGMTNDPWDKEKKTVFFLASTQINRKDFGLTWNKELDNGGLLLGEIVDIQVTIEAFEEGVRPAFSRFFLPTEDIKEEIENKLAKVTKESDASGDEYQAPAKKEVIDRPPLPSNLDMVLNILFGFVGFVVLIGGGIKLQIVLTNFLEKKNFSEKWTFLIPNIVVMLLIMYFATLLAPFMGYGPHPWGN